jgi:hypothetical protein
MPTAPTYTLCLERKSSAFSAEKTPLVAELVSLGSGGARLPLLLQTH